MDINQKELPGGKQKNRDFTCEALEERRIEEFRPRHHYIRFKTAHTEI